MLNPTGSLPPASRSGFSLLEVLAAMLILVIGIAGITGFLTASMHQNRRATDTSIAAYIAQMKAEEIRRDDTIGRDIIADIQGLAAETAPLTWPLDSRFAYSFSGVSPTEPLEYPGVARVIIRYDASFRSSQEILFELRFDD